jgi:hypothetical protein
MRRLTETRHSQKYGKIKTRDKEIFEGSGGGVATPSKKKTSTKPATPASKRMNGGKAKGAANGFCGASDGDEEDDDEEMKTPSKKVKIEAFELDDSGIENE